MSITLSFGYTPDEPKHDCGHGGAFVRVYGPDGFTLQATLCNACGERALIDGTKLRTALTKVWEYLNSTEAPSDEEDDALLDTVARALGLPALPRPHKLH